MSGAYNATLAEELGVDMSEYTSYTRVSDFEDLFAEVLAKRAELRPDLAEFPLMRSVQDWPHNFAIETFVDYFLGAVTNIPGIMDIAGYDTETVFNMYETEEYYDFAKTMVRFVQSGVLRSWTAANYFFHTSWGLVRYGEHYFTTEWIAQGLPAARTWATTTVLQLGVGISSQCPEKERAMMAIELMNTDADLATMIRFGIEGEHYVFDENGDMTFEASPRNSDPTARGYYRWYAAPIGNLLIARAPVSLSGPNNVMMDLIKEFNATSKMGHMGFLFDQDPVQNELAACTAVYQEYAPTISKGRFPNEEAIVSYVDEFNAKLYSNGLQRVIDEIQRQMDEWKAAN